MVQLTGNERVRGHTDRYENVHVEKATQEMLFGLYLLNLFLSMSGC